MLHCMYHTLGNASNPFYSRICYNGALFHYYKKILQVTKEIDQINEDALKDKLMLLLEIKPEDKILFYRFSKKYQGFDC